MTIVYKVQGEEKVFSFDGDVFMTMGRIGLQEVEYVIESEEGFSLGTKETTYKSFYARILNDDYVEAVYDKVDVRLYLLNKKTP